jgi:hypothetical protein
VVYLLWVDIFYFVFFLHSPSCFGEQGHRVLIFCGVMDVATISQCGSIVCVRDLDPESMTSF